MAKKAKQCLKRHEILDPTPLALPVGLKQPPTLQEQIRRMIRSEELRRAAEAAGHETFEESDDFEVGDDYDPKSPYEETFDPGLSPPSQPVPNAAKFTEETPVMQVAKDGVNAENKKPVA